MTAPPSLRLTADARCTGPLFPPPSRFCSSTDPIHHLSELPFLLAGLALCTGCHKARAAHQQGQTSQKRVRVVTTLTFS